MLEADLFLCGAIGLVAGAARHLAARRAAGVRAARVRARLGAPVSTEHLADVTPGSSVTVAGTLTAAARGVTTFFPFGVSLSEKASSEAVPLGSPGELTVGGVEIRGPVQVVLGDRETALRATPTETRALGLGGALPEEGMVRALAPGAEVLARGTLERTAGDTAEGYRAGSIRYHLAGPVELATTRTPRRPGRAALLAPLLTGALGVLLSAGALSYLETPKLPPAVTTPPPCAGEITRLLDRGDPWTARDRLTTCDWSPAAANVALHLGDLEGASRAFARARAKGEPVEPSITEVEVHMAAGNDALARQVLRAHPANDRRPGLLCIEGSLGRRAGQPDGAELLELGWHASPEDGACRLLADDYRLTPWAPTSTDWHLFAIERSPDDPRWITGSGARMVEWVGLFGVTSVLVNDPASRVPDDVALAASVLRIAEREGLFDRRSEDLALPMLLGRLAANVALFQVIVGEREDARAALAPLDRLAPLASDGAYAARVAMYHRSDEGDRLELLRLLLGYAAGVALHAGDEARLATYLAASDRGAGEDAIQRYVRQTKQERYEAPTLDHWNARLLSAAAGGDGREAARALADARTTGRTLLPRMLPKIRTNRDALVRWAHDEMPPADLRGGLLALAKNVGDRREAARVLGDRELEARWAPVARALRDAVLRRDGAPTGIALQHVLAPGRPGEGG